MMMKKYIRKPVAVEAFQWKGDVNDFPDGAEFIKCSGVVVYHPITGQPMGEEHWVWIKTPHGSQKVYLDEWIVREANGDFSVCKNDFDALYDPVL